MVEYGLIKSNRDDTGIMGIILYNTRLSMDLSSGKVTVCYGKSAVFNGKLIISMAILNSCVQLPEGTVCS